MGNSYAGRIPWLLACALVARPLGEWALWNGGPFGQSGDPAAVTGSNIQAAAICLGALIAVSFFSILSLGRTDKCWTEVHKGGKSWREALLAIRGSSIVAGAVGAALTWYFCDSSYCAARVGLRSCGGI